MTDVYSRAIIRALAATFPDCIRPDDSTDPIDMTLAHAQHDAYVSVLRDRGLEIERLDADERYPDCCFVEDPVLVVGDTAIICAMAADARRGEEVEVERALRAHRSVERLRSPATMDGGDVIRMRDRIFIGLTERTNMEAVRQVEAIAGPRGFTVTPVEVSGVLHLKSACTWIGDDTLLIDRRRADAAPFAGCRLIDIPGEESYAANCLAVNGVVVVSAGFPRTRDLLAGEGARSGFEVTELGMSEFRKAGGSLTCLSVLL